METGYYSLNDDKVSSFTLVKKHLEIVKDEFFKDKNIDDYFKVEIKSSEPLETAIIPNNKTVPVWIKHEIHSLKETNLPDHLQRSLKALRQIQDPLH